MSKAHDVESRPKIYKRIYLQTFSQEQQQRLPGIFVGSAEALTMSSARNIENRMKNVRALPKPNLDSHTMLTLSCYDFTGVAISLAHDLVGAWHWEAPKRFHCDISNHF